MIIVNYGTAGLAAEAVDSVLAGGHGGRQVDVHLVDNASPGGDARVLAQLHAARRWGGRVTLYPETVNHGFGRANNLVLAALARRAAPPDMVFLLNPDARVTGEAIATLAAVLETEAGVAAAGARVTKPDGGAVTCAFRFPSAVSEFSDTLNFGPVARLCARHSVALPHDTPTGPVGWVTGAAVMFRFAALREAGGFDPEYFLYYEEVDLMHRLTLRGHRIWHVAEAAVVHVEGAATEVRSGETVRRRRPAYWYESWRLYFLKTNGVRSARLIALAKLAGGVLHQVQRRLRGQEPGTPLQFAGDFRRLVLQPLFRTPARATPRHSPAPEAGDA